MNSKFGSAVGIMLYYFRAMYKRTLALLMLAMIPTITEAAYAWAFQVSLNGTVNIDNRPFTRYGWLYATPTITATGTTNGVNPVDIVLMSGTPIQYPEIGAIVYSTNYYFSKYFFGSLSQSAIDLAYVNFNGNCIYVYPDQNLLIGLNRLNTGAFTVSSSYITAQAYYVQQGLLQVCTTDGWKTFSGTIEFYGTSYYSNPYASMPYKASIYGQYQGIVNY